MLLIYCQDVFNIVLVEYVTVMKIITVKLHEQLKYA